MENNMDGIHAIARRVKDTGDWTADDIMALADFALTHTEGGNGGTEVPAADWIEVESKNISKFRYDHSEMELWVAFKSGAIWIYADVPAYLVTEFGEAESKGRFFHENIRSRYQARRPGEQVGYWRVPMNESAPAPG